MGQSDAVIPGSSSASLHMHYLAFLNLGFQVPLCHLLIPLCDVFAQYFASFEDAEEPRSKNRLSF